MNDPFHIPVAPTPPRTPHPSWCRGCGGRGGWIDGDEGQFVSCSDSNLQLGPWTPSREDIERAIADAQTIVSTWPEWKKNILNDSAKPQWDKPRPPVDNNT